MDAWTSKPDLSKSRLYLSERKYSLYMEVKYGNSKN